MIDLGSLGRIQFLGVVVINNSGTVVGYATTREHVSCLYLHQRRQNAGLVNKMIPPRSGWVLLEANGINDAESDRR